MSKESFPKAVKVALSRLSNTLDRTDFKKKNSGIGLKVSASQTKENVNEPNSLPIDSPMTPVVNSITNLQTSIDLLQADRSFSRKKSHEAKPLSKGSSFFSRLTFRPFVKTVSFFLLVHLVDLIFCLASIYLTMTGMLYVFLPEESLTNLLFDKGQVLSHFFPGWSWAYGSIFLYSVFLLYSVTFKFMVRSTLGHYVIEKLLKAPS